MEIRKKLIFGTVFEDNQATTNLKNKIMKKVTTLFAVAFAFIGASMAQMVIPGESFAKNPSSFNGRKVSIKNIQLDFSNKMPASTGAVAPVGGGAMGAGSVGPGPGGQGAQVVRCNPPRGFSQLDVNFLAAPDFEGCFYMGDAMYNELKRQAGGQSIDAQITFQGDSRIGYNVTFYKIGR
jgi:hypothetical protein